MNLTFNNREPRDPWELRVLVAAIIALCFFLSFFNSARAQDCPWRYESRVQVVGGMSLMRSKDAMRKGQHLVFQNANAGVIYNGVVKSIAMITYGQYSDSNYTAPRNTIGFETGLFLTVGRFTPMLEVGLNRAGTYVKPSLKVALNHCFALDLYYQQGNAGAGFFVNFGKSE